MKHQRFIFRVTVFLLFYSLLFIFCSKTGDATLATFNGGSVQTDEYIDYFLSSTKYKKDVLPDEDNLKHIVTLKALEKMAVLEAVEQGFENDSLYQESIKNNLRKTLFFKYMSQEIINRVITDSLIQAFHDNYTPQYHMSYIMRPVPRSSTSAFEQMQKDTINFVYGLLQNGHNFAELAAQYSQDITSNQKGGSLGFVIRESMGDAVLRAAMDTLKDLNWSTPIRGFEGYYILFKGEKREVPVPALNEIRDKIWQTLYRTRKHDIEKVLDQRFESLAAKYNYHVDHQDIEDILSKAGAGPTTFFTAPLDFDILTETDMARDIATYDGGALKLYEIFEEKNREPGNKLEFEERLETIAQRHLLSKHAIELGYQDQPDIKEKMQDVRESLLRSYLHRRNVIDVAKVRMDAIEEQERLSGTQAEPDRFRRVSMERQVREEFEEELKSKYDLQFVSKNFGDALKQAEQRKIEQVAE
ncbi:hypothetical protein EH223_13065 [candidate division KSB1 bacterium]|nr:peptidylprolyl isomerase [candidate division KSB1 bacterium]RQW02168.1 MAG: hypothetical protein EH223_13065 [candidate division KSB1 bacterium]